MSVDLFLKALNSVRAARDSLDEHRPDDAVSRAYYAMFNAARAFLQVQNVIIDDSSHGAVARLFGPHAIKTGMVPAKFGRALNRLQEARSIADYDQVTIPDADAGTLVEHAEQFVDLIRTLIPGLPALSVRGPSSKEKAETKLKESLAFVFCRTAELRGQAIPDGLEKQLVVLGSEATLSRLIAEMADMTDLISYLLARLPELEL